MIASNYIETLASLFEQYDVDGIGFSNKDFVDGENIYISRKRPPSLTGVMTGPEVFHVVINESAYNVESPFYAWKRSFLLDKKLYFYDGIYHEDNLYFFKSMICCQKILMIQDELYNYRKRFGSIVNQGIKLKHVDSMLYVCDEIRKEIGSLSGSVHEDALRFLRFNESMFCYKMMKFCYDNSIADKINCKYNLDVLEDTHRFAFDYTLAMLKYVNADRYILNDKETDYIKMYKSIIIYGAGIWARRVLISLGEKNIDDFVVAVTDNANAGKLLGNKIHQLNLLDVDYESTIVILAIGKKYKDEMREYAESLGFKHFLELRY